MAGLLELLVNKDFAAKASTFFNSLDTADPRFVAIMVAMLVFVGLKMVSGQPGLRAWGLRLGLATFLLYAGYAYYVESTAETRDLFNIALRSGNAGGCVLALTWIGLPIIVFVYGHLRLALAVFLGYGGYALVTADSLESEELWMIALRSLLAVTLALVIAWIVHPIWDFFKCMLPQ